MLEHWYAALHSPYGVILTCHGDPERIRQHLYAARKKAADEDLYQLALVQSPTTPGQWWIVKKQVNNHEA